MEFINTQMINVIQNISLKRDNKIITKSDMNHAYVVSHQLVFPGTTLFRKGSGTELIYSSYAMIYYVKGESNGKASCVWVCHMTSSSCTNPTLVQVCAAGDAAYSTVRWGTGVSPEKIHPSLKINEGEVKIIVENTLYWTTGFPDTAGKTYSTAREAFRYHFINPKERSSMYFNAVSIFTPKPGLFDETGPQRKNYSPQVNKKFLTKYFSTYICSIFFAVKNFM